MAKTGTKTAAEYANERIDFTLPFNSISDNEESETVIINGQVFQIKYGETVKIPRFVAEVLDRSMAAKIENYKRQQAEAN